MRSQIQKCKSLLLPAIFILLLLTGLVNAQSTSSTARRIIRGGSLPATCNPSDVYFVTGDDGYLCTAANTWTSITGGGGGGGSLTVGTTAIASGTAGRLFYEASGNVLGETGEITWDASQVMLNVALPSNAGRVNIDRTVTGSISAVRPLVYSTYNYNTGATTTFTQANAEHDLYGNDGTIFHHHINYAYAELYNTSTKVTSYHAYTYTEGTHPAVYGALFQLEYGSGTTNYYGLAVEVTGTPTSAYILYSAADYPTYLKGMLGLNTLSPQAQLHVVSNSASRVGLRVDSAASPSVDVLQVSADNGTTAHFAVTSTGAPSSPGAGASSERYGSGSTAAGASSIAIGNGTSAPGANNIIIGTGLTPATNTGHVHIGNSITSGTLNDVLIGSSTSGGGGGYNVAIGFTAITANGSTVVGGQATAAGGTFSIVLGYQSTATAGNQFVAGSSGGAINDVYFGKGVTNATPTAYTINGTGGSGTNIAGANLNLAGGKGTGTGTGGDVNIQFARAGSTGTSLNSLSTIMAFSGTTTATTATQTNVNGATTIQGQITENITLNTGGTTTDSTIDLPANSIILSVTARITTTITTATDWTVGDATTADRFSDANSTLTAGTTSVGINQWKADRTTAGQGPYQASTAKVRITTTGTPGAGVVRITIHYITLTAPTS